MAFQKHGDQEVAALGKSPAAAAGDLCQKAVHVETTKESAHLIGLTMAGVAVGRVAEQLPANVLVPHAVERVFSPQEGGKQPKVVIGGL